MFQLVVSVDDNYMFAIQQTVQNNGTAPISVHPWARIRRDYKPVTGGYYILHEGLLGVLDGTLQEQTYDKAKSESDKANGGPSLDMKSTGGWVGITDKYWLTAIIPDQATPVQADFRHLTENGADRYQADMVTENALTAAPGAAAILHDAHVRRRQGGAAARPLRATSTRSPTSGRPSTSAGSGS